MSEPVVQNMIFEPSSFQFRAPTRSESHEGLRPAFDACTVGDPMYLGSKVLFGRSVSLNDGRIQRDLISGLDHRKECDQFGSKLRPQGNNPFALAITLGLG